MIIYSKRLLMLKPQIVFEESNAGTYTFVLAPGRYEFTLIGSGGAGAMARNSRTGSRHYAQGGVGGTIQAIINNYVHNTLTITVAAGVNAAGGTYVNSGTTIKGSNGNQTNITGIPGVAELYANGGTAGAFTATSSTGGNTIPGTMGSAKARGDAVMDVPLNNPINVVSYGNTSTQSVRRPTGRANDNWPDDTHRGQGGDAGWSGTSGLLQQSGSGYVRIRRV